ncbi:MAG: helix-turn-helix transcriptional regulator [Labilithrix sp.]|nr:helix-turn-helix transcriptional regulator [Labilithrix sp.]MCW5816150.1 helix-turn-helix transcriptional regulator [Labilithrix sp.]
MTFGLALRRYRTQRGLSQERLAHEAEISTRHLSCLETGKAAPSRTMVLVLGSALDMSLRERNSLLEAAGFVAAYRDEPLDAPEAASLRRAVQLILDGMEPNGAVAVDRSWNVLQLNGGAARLLATFADVANAPPEVMKNLVVATLHPRGLRPAIVNFEEVAAFTIERSRREIMREGGDEARTRKMLAALEAIPDLPPVRVATATPRGPFLTVHLRKDGVEASIFSTVATIGTPIDATAEEITIETFFPADEATAKLFRSVTSS